MSGGARASRLKDVKILLFGLPPPPWCPGASADWMLIAGVSTKGFRGFIDTGGSLGEDGAKKGLRGSLDDTAASLLATMSGENQSAVRVLETEGAGVAGVVSISPKGLKDKSNTLMLGAAGEDEWARELVELEWWSMGIPTGMGLEMETGGKLDEGEVEVTVADFWRTLYAGLSASLLSLKASQAEVIGEPAAREGISGGKAEEGVVPAGIGGRGLGLRG